jgi:hypothetical protein
MALYSELPVFKKAYDLLLEVYLVHRDLLEFLPRFNF